MQQLTTIPDSERLHDPHLAVPRTVGDIIGATIRILRRNIKMLFATLFWPEVALAAVHVTMLFGAIQMQAAISMDKSAISSWSQFFIGSGIFLAALIIGIPPQLIAILRQLAFVRVIAGYSETFKEADRYLWKNSWKLLVLGVIYFSAVGLWLFIAFLILFVTIVVCTLLHAPRLVSILLGFTLFGITLISFIFIIAPIATVAPALACETRSFGSVLKDAVALAYRHLWRTCGFYFLLTLTIWLLGSTLGLPGQVVYVFEYVRTAIANNRPPTSAEIPFYAQAIHTVWASLVHLFVGPLGIISAGLYYLDLRSREQGLDILRQLPKTLEKRDD